MEIRTRAVQLEGFATGLRILIQRVQRAATAQRVEDRAGVTAAAEGAEWKAARLAVEDTSARLATIQEAAQAAYSVAVDDFRQYQEQHRQVDYSKASQTYNEALAALLQAIS